MTKAILTSNTTSTHITNVLSDHWIVPCNPTNHLLANTGPLVLSNVFETLCGFLELMHLTATLYYAQTNEHLEWYKKPTVAPLRQYVTEHKDDCNMFVRPLR